MSESWRRHPVDSEIEVSDLGRVRIGETIRSQYTDRKGYKSTLARVRKARKHTYSVHRLVLEAWVGMAPTQKHQAAHWNGDPSDNRLENLRWATQAENEADKVRHGSPTIVEVTAQYKERTGVYPTEGKTWVCKKSLAKWRAKLKSLTDERPMPDFEAMRKAKSEQAASLPEDDVYIESPIDGVCGPLSVRAVLI